MIRFEILNNPRTAPEWLIMKIYELLEDGGEVSTNGLIQRLRACEYIAYAEDVTTDEIVGVAAIKNPNPSYVSSIEFKSGYDGLDGMYELGYLYVNPDYRGGGIAKKLVKLLMRRVPNNVFSTTRADNKAVHRILESHGFEMVGEPYPSALGNGMIVLFVKE